MQHQRRKQLYTMHYFIKGFYTEALIAKAPFSSACICHVYNRKHLFKQSLFISFSDFMLPQWFSVSFHNQWSTTHSDLSQHASGALHPFPLLLCHQRCPWDLEGCHLPPDVLMWFNSLPSISSPSPQTAVSSETPTPPPQPSSAQCLPAPRTLSAGFTSHPQLQTQGHVIHLQLIWGIKSLVFHFLATSTWTWFTPLVPLARHLPHLAPLPSPLGSHCTSHPKR